MMRRVESFATLRPVRVATIIAEDIPGALDGQTKVLHRQLVEAWRDRGYVEGARSLNAVAVFSRVSPGLGALARVGLIERREGHVLVLDSDAVQMMATNLPLMETVHRGQAPVSDWVDQIWLPEELQFRGARRLVRELNHPRLATVAA
jgi:hypothetical protein